MPAKKEGAAYCEIQVDIHTGFVHVEKYTYLKNPEITRVATNACIERSVLEVQ